MVGKVFCSDSSSFLKRYFKLSKIYNVTLIILRAALTIKTDLSGLVPFLTPWGLLSDGGKVKIFECSSLFMTIDKIIEKGNPNEIRTLEPRADSLSPNRLDHHSLIY